MMETKTFSHVPVMFSECMDALSVRADGTYLDCTAGGGGHSAGILARLGCGGRLIAVDQDADAIAALTERFSGDGRVRLMHMNFAEAAETLDGPLDGVLMDLGVSSHQLDEAERGFSYMADAPLDMRMDQGSALTAADIVNTRTQSELTRILYDYGEERFAPKIAAAICAARSAGRIASTLQLSELIRGAIPASAREGGHHPAKRSFQAIRIAVNRELDVIAPALTALTGLMRPGGRIAVITFHSLEDRIVKQTFASEIKPCTCPPDFPVCVCGKKPRLTAVTRKPRTPSPAELESNPRSRSAKLRVCERTAYSPE